MTSQPASAVALNPSKKSEQHGLSVSRLANHLEGLLVEHNGPSQPQAQPTKNKPRVSYTVTTLHEPKLPGEPKNP